MEVKEAYGYIEKLITHGFLTVGLDFGGLYIVLKSMNDKEVANLSYYINEEDSRSDFLYKLCFSTLSISGENILRDRNDRVKEIKEFYRCIPSILIRRIVDAIGDLNKIYIESLNYLEGFCYTSKSRHLWKLWDQDKNIYGIPGSDQLGINNVQENWIIINKQLDSEEEYDREFNLSVLVASSFNAKGAKTISRNYDFHKKELKELRDEIAKYGYDKKRVEEQTKKDRWTAPVKGREDLVRELYRQMRGEKDKHDLFIDKWVEGQKRKAEDARKQAEERQKTYRKKLEDIDLTQLEDSRPVSVEEIEKIKKSRSKTTSKYMSAYEDSDQEDRFIKKISARVIKNDKRK